MVHLSRIFIHWSHDDEEHAEGGLKIFKKDGSSRQLFR